MPDPSVPSTRADARAIATRLGRDGYDFVAASAMRAIVDAGGGRDWDGYRASWERLGPDRFMADGGTYRRRRFACLSAERGGGLAIEAPRPHFQSREHNPLNGGIARTFEPVEERVALHPVNRALVAIGAALFAEAGIAAPARWHVEMHQFRIEARPDLQGRPTPEGLHRDGVDGVLVLMVGRENVAGGVSTIAGRDRAVLAEATLAEPGDASLLDDRRVMHGVSPIRAVDPGRPAHRDVLVLTFRARPPEA